MYHPTVGRWLQRDPLGYVDGASLYEYCGGMPGVATDPHGLASGLWNKIKEVIGGAWAVGPHDAYGAAGGSTADFVRAVG